jgi:hypothetical protein
MLLKILLIALLSSVSASFAPNSPPSSNHRDSKATNLKMISNVVIAIAMEAEASPFIQHLNLQPDTSFFPSQTPFHAFSGKHGSCNLTVVTNGKDVVHDTGVDNVGTVPAAVCAFLT